MILLFHSLLLFWQAFIYLNSTRKLMYTEEQLTVTQNRLLPLVSVSFRKRYFFFRIFCLGRSEQDGVRELPEGPEGSCRGRGQFLCCCFKISSKNKSFTSLKSATEMSPLFEQGWLLKKNKLCHTFCLACCEYPDWDPGGGHGVQHRALVPRGTEAPRAGTQDLPEANKHSK